MTDPANKTVLITGAGGGFGRHMVRQFRAAGAKLILTDLNDQVLDDVVDEAADKLVASVPADLSTEDGCEAIIETCARQSIDPYLLAPALLTITWSRAMLSEKDHPPARYERHPRHDSVASCASHVSKARVIQITITDSRATN